MKFFKESLNLLSILVLTCAVTPVLASNQLAFDQAVQSLSSSRPGWSQILESQQRSCVQIQKSVLTQKNHTPRLFRNSEPLDLELSFDAKMQGQLSSKNFNLSIQVEPRAQYRKRACMDMPPMRIRFLDSKEGTPFEGAGKTLKLVTPCYGAERSETDFFGKPVIPSWEERVKREYWVYKIMESSGLITQKVRWAKIKVNGKSVPAFFIEDIEDTLSRTDARELDETKGIDQVSLNSEVSLNILMSGSKDVDIPSRNVHVYQDSQQQQHLVQYDFDLSNLVYPDSWNGVLASWDGYYSGITAESAARALGKESKVFETIKNSDLSQKAKKEFNSYYEQVFTKLKAIQ